MCIRDRCIPFALLPEAQGIYSAYLAAHAASAAAPLIARHDTESLQEQLFGYEQVAKRIANIRLTVWICNGKKRKGIKIYNLRHTVS